MKRVLTALLASVALAGVLVLPPATRAQGKNSSATKSKRTRPEGRAKIHAAIVSLQAVKAELERDQSDFGGYRKDAIEAVDKALKQLRLALQFEKY